MYPTTTGIIIACIFYKLGEILVVNRHTVLTAYLPTYTLLNNARYSISPAGNWARLFSILLLLTRRSTPFQPSRRVVTDERSFPDAQTYCILKPRSRTTTRHFSSDPWGILIELTAGCGVSSACLSFYYRDMFLVRVIGHMSIFEYNSYRISELASGLALCV